GAQEQVRPRRDDVRRDALQRPRQSAGRRVRGAYRSVPAYPEPGGFQSPRRPPGRSRSPQLIQASMNTLLEEAQAAFAQGDTEGAATLLGQVAQLHPGDPDLLHRAGQMLLGMAGDAVDLERATAFLSMAHQGDPTRVDIAATLAQAHLLAGRA